MTDADKAQGWKPPYLPYTTLVAFIQKKLSGNIPPRIDRGFLESYSGSVQFLLTQALKTMEFIGENGEVLPALRLAAQGEDQRKVVFADWARQFYVEELALAENNATAQMLQESFASKGPTGSVLRKAIVFYLAMCDDLALPKSPWFKAPKQPTGSSSGKARVTKKATVAPKISDEKERSPAANVPGRGSADLRTVALGAAGTVTLAVDVRWLDLDDETFLKLRKCIRDIEALGAADDEIDEEEEEEDEL